MASQTVRLFVGGLPSDVTPSELASRFAPFGRVTELSIAPPTEAGGSSFPRRFAHLSLSPKDAASLSRCLSAYRGARWRDGALTCALARPAWRERLAANDEARERRWREARDKVAARLEQTKGRDLHVKDKSGWGTLVVPADGGGARVEVEGGDEEGGVFTGLAAFPLLEAASISAALAQGRDLSAPPAVGYRFESRLQMLETERDRAERERYEAWKREREEGTDGEPGAGPGGQAARGERAEGSAKEASRAAGDAGHDASTQSPTASPSSPRFPSPVSSSPPSSSSSLSSLPSAPFRPPPEYLASLRSLGASSAPSSARLAAVLEEEAAFRAHRERVARLKASGLATDRAWEPEAAAAPGAGEARHGARRGPDAPDRGPPPIPGTERKEKARAKERAETGKAHKAASGPSARTATSVSLGFTRADTLAAAAAAAAAPPPRVEASTKRALDAFLAGMGDDEEGDPSSLGEGAADAAEGGRGGLAAPDARGGAGTKKRRAQVYYSSSSEDEDEEEEGEGDGDGTASPGEGAPLASPAPSSPRSASSGDEDELAAILGGGVAWEGDEVVAIEEDDETPGAATAPAPVAAPGRRSGGESLIPTSAPASAVDPSDLARFDDSSDDDEERAGRAAAASPSPAKRAGGASARGRGARGRGSKGRSAGGVPQFDGAEDDTSSDEEASEGVPASRKRTRRHRRDGDESSGEDESEDDEGPGAAGQAAKRDASDEDAEDDPMSTGSAERGVGTDSEAESDESFGGRRVQSPDGDDDSGAEGGSRPRSAQMRSTSPRYEENEDDDESGSDGSGDGTSSSSASSGSDGSGDGTSSSSAPSASSSPRAPRAALPVRGLSPDLLAVLPEAEGFARGPDAPALERAWRARREDIVAELRARQRSALREEGKTVSGRRRFTKRGGAHGR